MNDAERERMLRRLISETPNGMADCKRALRLANWNFERARFILDEGIEEWLIDQVQELGRRLTEVEQRIDWRA